MRNWPEDAQPASSSGEGGVGCKRDNGCILSPSVWVGKTHQWGSEQMGGVAEVAEAKGCCLPASWA